MNSLLRLFVLNVVRKERNFVRSKPWHLNLCNSNLSSYSGKSGMHLTAVVAALESIAPLHFAEPWDNVGLLIEPTEEKEVSRILLTIDLTEEVLTEAVSERIDLIVAYHPPIFRPMKNLCNDTWKNRIVLKCIEEKIAVYSPHTALDAIDGGINDWLLCTFDCRVTVPIIMKNSPCVYSVDFECYYTSSDFKQRLSELMPKVKIIQGSVRDDIVVGRLKVNESDIDAVKTLAQKENFFKIAAIIKDEPDFLNTSHGQGRHGLLQNSTQISVMVEKLKCHLGLERVRISLAKGFNLDSAVQSVAVCAGSGAEVLKKAKADVFITGEMSHHELLDAAHSGTTVILLEHSNSERHYLGTFAQRIREKVSSTDRPITVSISTFDKDPVSIV